MQVKWYLCRHIQAESGDMGSRGIGEVRGYRGFATLTTSSVTSEIVKSATCRTTRCKEEKRFRISQFGEFF